MKQQQLRQLTLESMRVPPPKALSTRTGSVKPPCLEFFAGSGLVAEGLKDFFETIWANDICGKKARVFCANHSKTVFDQKSVEQVRGETLPAAALSWGSFPCQDLSLAGKIGGLSSARSGLFWQWLRVMDELSCHPPLVVAENVIGLVSAGKGANYRLLHQALVERGYRVGAVVLDAAHWLPQSRKRVFVIAVDKRVSTAAFEAWHPEWPHPPAVVRSAKNLENWVWWHIPRPQPRQINLDDIVNFTAPCDGMEQRDRLLSLIPETHHRKMAEAVRNGQRVFPGYKRIRNGRQVLELRFDGLAGCLRTPQGGSSRQFLVIHNNGAINTRLLTLTETAALMGAPAHYQIPGSYNEGYKAMGDAVAVPVARHLAETLLAPLAYQIIEEGYFK